MRISDAFPSKFLKASDLQNKHIRVVIQEIRMEEVGGNDVKPVVYFTGKEKGLVLNKTNGNAIATAYGDETDAWGNKQIVLFTAQTQMDGRSVDCIRCYIDDTAKQASAPVAPVPPPPPVETHAPVEPDDIPF